MHRWLKKILPPQSIAYYRMVRFSWLKQLSRFRGKTTEETFTEIYTNNYWKDAESVSGAGSSLGATAQMRPQLAQMLKQYAIKSLLDIPCGDFNWMQAMDLSDIAYVGADIVREMIHKNQERFGKNTSRSFVVLDITKDQLPTADLVFVRDCWVHLSYEDISKSLHQIRQSNSTYLLSTTFRNAYRLNYDIQRGDWRPLNLQKKPFSFPSPLHSILENTSTEAGEFSDKCLALWRIEDLPKL